MLFLPNEPRIIPSHGTKELSTFTGETLIFIGLFMAIQNLLSMIPKTKYGSLILGSIIVVIGLFLYKYDWTYGS